MKFALIDGDRREPTPGSTGRCPGCGQEVVAKCGSLRLWHWAHKGRRNCDPWWEPETEWHRAWKNLFPQDWQEVPHRADEGELHIADIRTPDGLVLEFQHSAIKPAERLSRERFYKRMLWIVDGSRLKNDRPRIDREIQRWRTMEEMKFHVAIDPDSTFPQRWLDALVPVLFDFDGLSRDEDFPEEHEGKPRSVLRNKEWWSIRGAKPDPLVCLVPNPGDINSIYFIIRREAFLDAAVNNPEILDASAIMQRFTREQHRRLQAYMSIRRGRRTPRF
ncbi:competence protein CoiA family protein [uncultured Paracoccus sp.]|uniref:competence protein CoiA n=1 Tax=uncultured Paracoccus sp. TaxID=189685 RepID=UPI0026100999|nr:competence protein CoiA family protein [uncultured Paracoccus sp.]